MGQKIISAIDIRADKVICLIAQELQILDKGKILQLIGIGTSKLKVNCLKPFSLETDEIKNHLDAAISKAEVDAGIKISNVYVSISENMKSDYIEFENKISGRIITENDIKSFFEDTKFKRLYTETDEPLHSFPISYKVDNKKSLLSSDAFSSKKISEMVEECTLYPETFIFLAIIKLLKSKTSAIILIGFL